VSFARSGAEVDVSPDLKMVLVFILVVGGWFVLQKWILPAAGVST